MNIFSAFDEMNILTTCYFKLLKIASLVNMNNYVGIFPAKLLDKFVKYFWLMVSQDDKANFHKRMWLWLMFI